MTSIGKFSPNELNHIRLSSDQSNQGIGLTGSMNTSSIDAHFKTKCNRQFSGAGTQKNRILDPERISSPQIAWIKKNEVYSIIYNEPEFMDLS